MADCSTDRPVEINPVNLIRTRRKVKDNRVIRHAHAYVRDHALRGTEGACCTSGSSLIPCLKRNLHKHVRQEGLCDIQAGVEEYLTQQEEIDHITELEAVAKKVNSLYAPIYRQEAKNEAKELFNQRRAYYEQIEVDLYELEVELYNDKVVHGTPAIVEYALRVCSNDEGLAYQFLIMEEVRLCRSAA